MCVFFFKQKTAYEMRISDWSSDVCSSDLRHLWLKDAQRSSLFIKLMHQVQDIARGAAEPVEPQHDQLVAGVHKLHDRFQFRAPAPRGPRSGLGTDNFATCILEAANLDIQILVRGADAGISDTSQ